MRIVVVGGSGFIGSKVCAVLRDRGVDVVSVHAPRLQPVEEHGLRTQLDNTDWSYLIDELQFHGAAAVVNAAGIPDASSLNEGLLYAANSLLPGALATAASAAKCPRFVHISSAVVQGRLRSLDESTRTDAFSPYARSKALGEELAWAASRTAVTYRPPSVHHPSRRITRALTRIAASPLSTVAAPASSPSPQAHVDNVAEAICFLATCAQQPPRIVMHPWEGHSTSSVLKVLGGKAPLVIPRRLAQTLVTGAWALARVVPALSANTRRIEMLWFGQNSDRSWLQDQGWVAPAGAEAWDRLAWETREQFNMPNPKKKLGRTQP